jgi:hypothetical protein
VIRPTIAPASAAVIAGTFPPGETRYYLALDAQPGDLMTQLTFSGREGAGKEVEIELLDASARARAIAPGCTAARRARRPRAAFRSTPRAGR